MNFILALFLAIAAIFPSVASQPTNAPANVSVTGTATWYRAPSIRDAAAGPGLRVGHWRGSTVTVCALECITVRLTDWCACPHHLIDLDSRAFRRLAPLSVGVVRVTILVGGLPIAPATDYRGADTMTDRTPTTAAGRAAMRGIIGGSLALWRDEPDAIADLILAIEAEARAEVTDDMTTAYMVGFENGKDEARAPLEAEIDALRAALEDCYALLPPERVSLIRDTTRAALEEPTP
jgi:hypothetical protein